MINLTVEELIKAALSQEKVEEEKLRLTEMERFLIDIGAESSDETERTDAMLIYWRYLKWCKEKDKEPIKRRQFFIGMKKIFKYFRATARNVYYVKQAPFEIDKDEWWQMRAHLRKEKNRKYETRGRPKKETAPKKRQSKTART